MDFISLSKERYSVRKFSEKTSKKYKLDLVLKAGQLAPAALLVCYDQTVCWHRQFDGKSSGEVDASIVTTHMMIEAADIGLGSTAYHRVSRRGQCSE